ncbi:MAG: hypothetical protein RLZZ127_2743 [Planctomycetota bacterium]
MSEELTAFMATLEQVLPGRQRRDQGPFRWWTPCIGAEQDRLERMAQVALERLGSLFGDLGPLAPADGWLLVVVRGVDEQLAYEGLFPGDGESILNGGCWRSWPVGHIALPLTALDMPDAALAHELVHALLDPRGVPLWIQEGIATGVEERLGHRVAPLTDPPRWRDTIAWWRERGLDAFWDGSAFPDPIASERAYDLAQVLAQPWFADRGLFSALVGADWTDEDGMLRRLLGRDREALSAGILAPPAPKGWLARLIHSLIVDPGR